MIEIITMYYNIKFLCFNDAVEKQTEPTTNFITYELDYN